MEPEKPNQPAIEHPRGRHSAKLDEKHRLKLPAPFMEYLNSFPEKKLFVTSIDRTTAQIYPISVWRENERLLRDYKGDPQTAKDVIFNANDLGADAEMDNQGRILMNTDLRQELDMEAGQTFHVYVEKGRIKVLTEMTYQAERQARAKRAVGSAEKMEMEGLL